MYITIRMLILRIVNNKNCFAYDIFYIFVRGQESLHLLKIKNLG